MRSAAEAKYRKVSQSLAKRRQCNATSRKAMAKAKQSKDWQRQSKPK
nr:MAG TPA: hypothetical protein [Bacteriophage sp.]